MHKMVEEISNSCIDQINQLVKKSTKLEELKRIVTEELDELQERIQEPLQGTIVYKKICCHKKACSTCGGTQNAHGPYPHLVWTEKGKTKSRYISRRNFPVIEEQLALSKKLESRQRLLVKIREREDKIFSVLDFAHLHLSGKEVHRDVQV